MTTPALSSAAVATLRDVVVVHGDRKAPVYALGGVTLEIRKGDRLALLGRSGSGKTTLLHVLGGLITPNTGTVDREPSATVRSSETRNLVRPEAVAFVFQGANLLPNFTAFENVAFAATVARPDVNPRKAVEELLRLVGLTAKLDHLPSELSGGEAQRVALARALAQQPQLLLCDEPTGHLDTDTAERVLDLIDALQAEFRFSLVVATHDVDVAARLDHQLELDDGLVIRSDEP